jgi:hypothetical protein
MQSWFSWVDKYFFFKKNYVFIYLFLQFWDSEFRAWHLLGRCSTTWVTPPPPYPLGQQTLFECLLCAKIALRVERSENEALLSMEKSEFWTIYS